MPPEDKKDDKSKKEDENDGAQLVPADARVMWFEDKVCSAFKVKADKFKKLISIGEYV
jgi:hypothetical protein